MANNALKTELKTDLIELIKDNFVVNDNYYLFISRSIPYVDLSETTTIIESDFVPPSIGESSRNVYDTYRNMLFLKRIQDDNIRIVIPRVNWSVGEVYTAYSETTDMSSGAYYVFTSDYNVYKCMTSNGASTVMPTGKSTDIISLSDGYRWKYIYSVPEDYLGFITDEYIPVYIASATDIDRVEQKLVQQQARPSSIDSVSMDLTKSPIFDKIFSIERYITDAYTVYLQNNLGIVPNVAGSSYIAFDAKLENPSVGNSYWNDYAIHITDGSGVGQYFRIINFVSAGNSYHYANVHPSISRSLASANDSNPSRFKIVPYVVVDGDGQDGIVVPVTSSAKKITSLSLLNSGVNYTYANPRVVTESSSTTIGGQVSLLNNSMSANLSTPRGHGVNAIREFGAADLMIVMEIDGTEGGKISTRNEYRKFGILKNPYLYGGLTLAGEDENVALKLLIKKEPTKTSTYRSFDEYQSSTFVPGNYIFGKESRASAKIVDSLRIPGSEFHQINVEDVVGNFRFSDEASLRSRVYFGTTFAGTFHTGDSAFQYSSIVGMTTSASGTVVSFDMYEKSILLDCTSGAFVEGKNIYFTVGSTLPSTSIVDVDEEFGEKIGQIVLGNTFGSSFLLFGSTLGIRDENYGRIASTNLEKIQVKDVGEYDLTTKLTIVSTGSSFVDGIITTGSPFDATIQQIDSTTLKKTTGIVVDFVVPTKVGMTGTIYLSDVKGTFNTTDPLKYSAYGLTAETSIAATINEIVSPEIEIGSGQMLYIENVRPIERNYEQAEEFKIVIGF